jgi:transposase
MCGWMADIAGLLQPIVKEMKRRVLLSQVIQTDDTPVKVQLHPGPGTKTGRLWVYLGDRDHKFVVYDYTPDRSGNGPEQFLKEYRTGYLQSDAYAGYNAIHERGIVAVGCWAHARRKFYDARTSDPERSHAAIAWIGRLYELERAAKEQHLDDNARHALRQERSRPILNALGEWLRGEAVKVLPKSAIGDAIAYTLSNWPALSRYVEAECLSIDNNASENAMRPIAVGRKNWLFCGSDAGGQTAATLMSLTASCKAWNVEPFAYLRDMLERVSTHPASRIADLLPDCWKPAESTEPTGRKE